MPTVVQASACTSPDGVTWSRQYVPPGAFSLARLLKVAYGGGRWVALGAQGSGFSGMTAVSTDGGVTWLIGFMNWWNSSPFNNYVPSDIAYGDGVFVAVGESDGPHPVVQTSSDGLSWTDQPSPMDGWSGVAPFAWAVDWNGSEFLIVGLGGTSGPDAFVQVQTSPDGVTWTSIGAGFPWGTLANRIGFAMGGLHWSARLEEWILANGNGYETGYGNVATSPDGTVWTIAAALPNDTVDSSLPEDQAGLDESADYIVAAIPTQGPGFTFPDSQLAGSPDGITWSTLTTPWNSEAGLWRGVAYGDGKFVAIGDNGTDSTNYLVSTDDGASWTAMQFPGGFTPFGIRFADGEFVCVGQFEFTEGTGWHVGSIALQ